MIRPAEHLVFGEGRNRIVVIDGRFCAWLNKVCLDKLRSRVRGENAELDHMLMAIRVAGIAYDTESSAPGSKSAPVAEPMPPSPQHQNSKTISTISAAAALGVTDRAIRRAITEKRLAATKDDGGRYRITEDELRRYAASKTGEWK